MHTLEKKAAAGDLTAQFYLSVIYEDGRGVPRDTAKAAEWCALAAQAGDRQSQYRLSKMLESGCGFEKRDERAAWYWLDKAAAQGHVQAQFELGLRHLFGLFGVRKTLFRAKRWLVSAAQQEHVEANFYLGFMHLHGMGFVEDPDKAFDYFKKAAQLNSVKAQCSLAFMYEHGIGCRRDLRLARTLYERSANGGHVGAQFGLACLALSLENFNDALIWLDIAANNGISPAQALLAKMYGHGIGVGRDLVKSLMWCLIVQESEDADEESLATVNLCCKNVAPFAEQKDLDEAYTLARDWLDCRAQVPDSVETNWGEQVKRGAHFYEEYKKRWV